MRSLSKPTIDYLNHFKDRSVSTYNKGLKQRLLASEPFVAVSAQNYEVAGTQSQFHSLVKAVGAPASDAELAALYERTMLPKNMTAGRAVYSAIRHAAAICPFCNQRDVKTLDHYLPQESFPDLAVLPVNLVPACYECNNKKLTFRPTIATQQLFHPYYDSVASLKWLRADVHYVDATPTLQFWPTIPAGMNPIMGQRVIHHFNKLNLSELYATYGNGEVNIVRYGLKLILQARGATAVRDNLLERQATCAAADLNSWQTATYEALAKSVPFCAGKFG